MGFNPFPGLRSFETDEDRLFFGRETESNDLVRRLRATRFLAVVGPSGSGKSSLVRSGLIPSLRNGSRLAGSSWRIAVLTPGDDPIGRLAAALGGPAILDGGNPDLVRMEATLRRNALGLADAVRQAHLPSGDNLLVFVDQFEELFRFGRSQRPRGEHQIANSRDEAIAFVKLLLHAARQHDTPVSVVLTMRSDFIGDCMDFPGLSEAVNTGLSLVGRMSREAWQSAITGPVAVGGGTIAPRLLQRVLDDLRGDHEELPRVQHALMRTWDHWERTRSGDRPMDVADYEAAGTCRHALSKHAEEAYEEVAADGGGRVAERIFKALTDTVSDALGAARPTRVQDLAAICGSSEASIVGVVEIFRRPGRRFLTPHSASALTGRSIVDLSHESLMRCWERLVVWTGEERESAGIYARLSHAAAGFEKGPAGAGSWRDAEIERARAWKREHHPTPAWARRYDDAFERAMSFLDRSLEERDRLAAKKERKETWRLRRVQGAAAVLGVLLGVAASLVYLARRESNRAEMNLALAREVVDESLSSVDRDLGRSDVDVPEVLALRRELLEKAERFYTAVVVQEPRSEASLRLRASARLRLGHINRMRQRSDVAAREYQIAIDGFRSLATAYPANREYPAALANAYTWLGDALRPAAANMADAEQAYDNAFLLQQAIVQESPQNTESQAELARIHHARAILRSSRPDLAHSAGIDFREAIRLLEPLAAGSDRAAQELARSYNNLGSLLAPDLQRSAEVVALWEKAIGIDERLVIKDPGNRNAKLELAILCNNLAALLHDRGKTAEADRRSRMAVDLIENLSRAAPSLAIVRAGAHSLRGMILEAGDPSEAASEYEEALDLFEQLRKDRDLHRLPEFHLRLGDLLLNLATFPKNSTEVATARVLLSDAVSLYAGVAAGIVASGSRADAQTALENLSRVLPSLPEPDRAELTEFHQQLQRRLAGDAARR